MTILQTRALLVKVTPHRWGIATQDSGCSTVLEQHYHANAGSTKVSKFLARKAHFKQVNAAISSLNSYVQSQTVPWRDGGWRALSATQYQQFTEQVAALASNVIQLYESSIYEKWDAVIVPEAKRDLGELAKDVTWPSVDKLRKCNYVEIHWDTITDPTHVLADIAEDLKKEISAELQIQEAQSVKMARRDTARRFMDVLSHIANKLAEYDPQNKKLHPFRNNMFDHLRELLDMLPDLNITGDEYIDGVAASLRQTVLACKPDHLRESNTLRQATVNHVNTILKDMGDYYRPLGEDDDE